MGIALRDISEHMVYSKEDGHFAHRCVQTFTYQVVELSDSDEEVELGSVSVALFDPGGHPQDLLDEADEVGTDLEVIAQFFYEQGGGVLDYENPKGVDFGCIRRLLYIECVKIVPEHRGKGLGLDLVRALYFLHGGVGELHVALIPSPVEGPHTDQGTPEEEAQAYRKKGEEKLWNHWSKLGFNSADREANILWNNAAWVGDFCKQYES